jgi:MFS family permease
MHAPLSSVGLILAAFGVASMVSRLLGGALADSWGRRTTMVLGLVACATAQLAVATSPSLTWTTISVVALGLAFEIYESPCQAFIADSVEGPARAAAFGLLGASLSAAALGAGLIATVLAPLSLRLLFVVDAATCLAAGIMVLRLLPGDVPAHQPDPALHDLPRPWRSRPLRFLFTANVVFAACYLQLGVSLPLTLQHRGVAASGYGVILVTSSVVVIAAQPLLHLRRRRGPAEAAAQHTAPVVVGCLLLAGGLAGYGEAQTLAGFVAATVVVGIGEVFLAGHLLAMVSAIAPVPQRGRYLAVFGLSWGVAATLGPVPATLVLEHLGDRILWNAAAGCCVAVALAHALVLRRVRWPSLPNAT